MNNRRPVDPRVATVDERTVAQIIERASSPHFDRWWATVAYSGFCAAPVHLAGSGLVATPVLARCKNRRASVCPSCSRLYAGDMWQLVHRGLVADDTPAVFATLTAPSFGRVHRLGTCHATRRHRCPHRRPTGCGATHSGTDSLVGTPLCAACYDYPSHVLFTWHAPELWHRFTIRLRRNLRRALRAVPSDPADTRLSYVKIVELQQRGVPHYHVVFRLDSMSGAEPSQLTSAQLAELVVQSADATRLRVPGGDDDTCAVRFGEQVDAQPIGDLDLSRRRAIAGYLAKYVTKSVADVGLSPRRLSPEAIERLAVSDHVSNLLVTLVHLAEHPDRTDMLRWLHTLGYRGHVSSKTRQYSTTMTALRAQRAAWREDKQVRADCAEGPTWTYAGNGHSNDGERLLATSAALRAIEQQRVGRQAVRDELEEST